MTQAFNKNGNDYFLKEVTRKKPTKCKVCDTTINAKEKARVLMSSGLMGDIWYCVGIFHLQCYSKFEFIEYKISNLNNQQNDKQD